MGSFFLRSRSSRSKVKFLYLGSPWSDLHEIGECILYRLIPDLDLWVQLGQRSSRSKVKFMCFFSVGHVFVLFVFIAAIILLLRRDG